MKLTYYLRLLNIKLEELEEMTNGDIQGLVECVLGYGHESDECLDLIRQALTLRQINN